ncbi:FAD-binding protein [Pseudomonas sp. Fl5BN2]|uniref:FAD-binding oxidoreductase n=1 Tax=unclassified Pseudomonas TaxID=196821 RepID=UPI00137809F2|nr:MULTISPECIES: FAD-binding oxidoreductase [unclassified Pseudomonas]NBF06955.1 FAD-binding protein [Pseudomonas sp. Fl5BN2]NBF11755.1 FAD-binding protein [Pseudomonas sp. Fl4BN1]
MRFAIGLFFCATLTTALNTHAAETVNDITQLNPIVVDQVVQPTTLEQIIKQVAEHPGPIAIGGGRYSMGGQTATEQALQIDMRRFNRILGFARERKEITVQPGITWRALQSFIDPYDLSVSIMQSYANFTVGGALSVNAHGRYVGYGPLVTSVKSIKLVLADGQVIEASPTSNAQLFYGAIGGYGGLGVIVEATLRLSDNVRLLRSYEEMPLADYRSYFSAQVERNPKVILHNAVLYPNQYQTLRAVSFSQTELPLTVEERLTPLDRNYWKEQKALKVVSQWPMGKTIRQDLIDPLVLKKPQVSWRNHEASLDVRELEPDSRAKRTYVLQEYFVPPAQLESFVQEMGETLRAHKVNVINLSIRHAKADPGTLLAWAKTEVFALVLYYQQSTAVAERAEVGDWTRALVDSAIKHGGSYYLPYQVHATPEQFRAAYPRAEEFFALKARVDPQNKFRNKLWDAYGPAGRN